MFQKGSKYLLLLITFLSACNSGRDKKSNDYVKINFISYRPIYTTIKDSMYRYNDALLKYFSFVNGESYQVDSLVCINSHQDRIVTTINISTGAGEQAKSDAIYKLLGKKINGNWYFLEGETLIVPRDMYGKDEMNPISFHELSQIARKEFLESALIKKDGEYVVNDKWVDAHFFDNGWGKFTDPAKYDSVHWFYIMDKWKHKIDTNEYKPIKKVAKPNS